MERIESGIDAQAEATRTGQGKIHCANCIHCKVVQAPAGNSGQYHLRVKCDAGKWLKKQGGEKIHKYFTVSSRSIEYCDSYVDMGDSDDFLSDLRRVLPIKDEVYGI